MNEEKEVYPLVNNGWGKYLALAIFMFVVIKLETVLGIPIVETLSGKARAEWQGSDIILVWITTIFIWGLGSFIALKYSTKKLLFSPFAYKEKPEIKNVLTAVIIVIFFTGWHWLQLGAFKPLVELNGHSKAFGKLHRLTFFTQYIYYIFEMIVATSIVVYFQKAGEYLFKNQNIPWGGIFLGLTWGLNHIFAQSSVFSGIYALINGIAIGIIC